MYAAASVYGYGMQPSRQFGPDRTGVVTPTAREIVAAADTSPASQAQKRLDGMVASSAGR